MVVSAPESKISLATSRHISGQKNCAGVMGMSYERGAQKDVSYLFMFFPYLCLSILCVCILELIHVLCVCVIKASGFTS